VAVCGPVVGPASATLGPPSVAGGCLGPNLTAVDTSSLPSLADADLATQVAELERLLRASPVVWPLLDALPGWGLPGAYIGAGAVAQTVWNAAHGFPLGDGIKDADVVYFDSADLSAESEERAEERVARSMPALGVKVDLTNEARVHLWYEGRFGVPLEPYGSSEAAIATWPTTASSIAVRPDPSGRGLTVCAPFGLRDLFALIVRPNKTLVTEEVYTAKAARWQATWPRLTVMAW
jgi:hypothetical protein